MMMCVLVYNLVVITWYPFSLLKEDISPLFGIFNHSPWTVLQSLHIRCRWMKMSRLIEHVRVECTVLVQALLL